MRLQRLRLKNFFSYAESELDLSRISLCSVVGPNGSGKSSLIVEAILWAIFGHAKLANKDLVRSGTTEAQVDLAFELDGHQYEVVRSFGKAMEVELKVDGKPLAQGKKTQVEELLKRLGIDRDLLMHSVVVSQGQLSSFVSAAPAERRELIRDMLGLQRFDKAHETARTTHLNLRATIDAHDKHVGTLRQQLSRYPEPPAVLGRIQHIKGKVDQAAADLEQLVARREKLAAQDQAARFQVASLQESLQKLQSQRADTTARIDRQIREGESAILGIKQAASMIPERQRMVAALEVEFEQAEQVKLQIVKILEEDHRLDEEIHARTERIQVATKTDGTCPLCGSQIGTERFAQIIAQMKQEILEMGEQRARLEKPKQKSSPATIRQEIDANKSWISQNELRLGQRQGIDDSLKKLREDRDKAIADFDIHVGQVTADLARAQGQLNAEVAVLGTQIEQARSMHKQVSVELERANGERVEQEALFRQLEEAQAHLALNQSKFPETEFVAGALAPTGIQLMIVDHYLPLIEGRSQDLLTRMSDGVLSMQLRTIEGRGVELMAGTDCLRPVRALSGGEQTRVSLAVRLALSQVLSEMVGMRWDCVVIDEPEWLDPAGIDQFIQAVHRLSEQFPQIFVVSHYAELQRAFPSTIMVRKVDGVSQVEVQA